MAVLSTCVARSAVILAWLVASIVLANTLAVSAIAQTNQTITFGVLSNKTYGAAPFTVSATASSGLTVSFASLTTPVCTVSGTTVTIVAVGTCTIQASQAGNATYAPAANVSQSFAVGKANQTITFAALTGKTYGAAPFTVSATASSGLAVAFASMTTAVCTVSGNTVTLAAGGTCTIQASQAGNGNYSAAPNVSQSFTVMPASQTITFGTPSEQAVGMTSTLTATASSGLVVTFTSLTTPVCTVSGTALTPVAVGTCAIQASQPGNATYSAAVPVSRSFNVVFGIQFAPQVTYITGAWPWSLAAGDFNGDGKLDFAVTNEDDSTISILLGNGDGTFVLSATLPTNGGFPRPVVAADLNGDGKLDLVVGNVWGNTVTVYLGTGNGTFVQRTTFGVGGAPYGIAVADLDHDGWPDLVVTDGSDFVTTGRTVEVLLGNGDGTFRQASSFTAGTFPYGVAIGDINGDGKPDIAVSNAGSNNVSILLGNGDGTFTPAVSYPVQSYPEAISLVDLNADSRLDLVVTNSWTNTVSIFLGRGDGSFAPRADVVVGQGPAAIAVADFNGDGKPDLAVANSGANNVAVLLGVGDGSFRAPLVFPAGTAPTGLVTGDFNRDGKADLIVANWQSNTISVLLNASSFTPIGSITPQAGTPQSAAVNTAFLTPLSASVRDGSNNPLAGALVTFAGPTSGASGTFSGGSTSTQVASNGAGVATAPTFTANGTSGTFSVTARAGSATALFALTNTGSAQQAPTFTSGPPPNGTINLAYSFTLTANGSPTPTFSVTSSTLPAGLSLNGTSGLINGTPSARGTFAGTFIASNSVLPNASQTFAITIAGMPQTISFGALTSRSYGTAPFAVSATASSGLAVSLSSLTTSVCTVSVATVTLVATGTCTIQASQAGNATYTAASSVTQSFSITKSAQTITFGALTNRPLGVPSFTVNATASSGLSILFTTTTPSVCTSGGVAGSLITLMTLGTCSVQASQPGDANYNPASTVSQSFTVQSTQTISFGSLPDQRLGTSPFAVSATTSSALAVIFSSQTMAVCAVSGNTVTLLAMGTCTIRASQPGNTNYSAAPEVDQSFAITALSIALVTPANGSTYTAPANIRFTAAPAFSVGTVTKVEYFNGAALLGAVTTAPYAFTWPSIGAGSYVVTAKVTNSGGMTFASMPANIVVHTGQGATFARSFDTFVGGGYPSGLAVGDLNGDGKLDVAWPFLGNFCNITLLGDGKGSFLQRRTNCGGAAQGGRVLVADFNRDGKPDLANAGGNMATIMLGNGDGSFNAARSNAVGDRAEGIATADFNGDGKLDLAVSNLNDNTISILLGNGDGTFRPGVTFPVGPEPLALATADINGDGKLDLAVTDTYNSTVSILLGSGDGTFQPARTFATGPGPFAIVLADFNGDGKLDLVTANFAGDNVSVLLGNGDGTFQPPRNFPAGGEPWDAAVADLNGDGKLDLVVTNRSDNTISVLLGSGNGTFQAPTSFVVGSYPSYVAVGDLDGDGRPDLVVANEADLTLSVLLNTSGRTIQAPVFTSAPLPNGNATNAYNYAVTASGVPSPSFVVTSGALPPGLTLQRNGFVTGTLPPPGSTYTGTITAKNGIAPDATQTFSITPAWLTQTIVFDPIVLVLMPPAVNATASSGFPVTLASLTPASCQLSGSTSGSQIIFQVIAGTCSIRASQGGGGAYLPAPNVDQAFTFDLNPPLISLSSPASNTNYGAPATITLTASLPSNLYVGLVNHIDFYEGNKLIGTVSARPYTVAWTKVGVGTYTLTAKVITNFQGGTAVSSPITVTVSSTPPPTVNLTAPPNNATYPAPANITLTASATSNVAGGSIRKVEFYSGNTRLSTVTTAPYSFTWTKVAPGPYTLTAKATDNLGVTVTSTPVTVIVTATLAAPTITLTTPTAGTEYAIGQGILLTAQASTPGRTIDHIEFYADGNPLGSVPVGNGFATATMQLTWPGASLGTHNLSAKVVATDGASAVSSSLSIAVSDLATILVEPYAGQTYLAPADVRLTASPSETIGTIAKVDFYFDGVIVGSSTAAPYSFLLPGVAGGNHTVSAVVLDAAGLRVASAPVQITVVGAPTVQVDAGVDGATVGDDNVSISGTVRTPSNSAVTVNGQLAALDATGRFFVNKLLLQYGSNIVAISVMTPDGHAATNNINVNSNATKPFDVDLDKQEGIAPFDTTLTITNRGAVAFQRIEIDLNGGGTPEITLVSLPDNQQSIDISFPAPGLYAIGVKVFDASNTAIYTAVRKVLVWDPRSFATRTIGVYTGMLDRLRQGDINGALMAVTGSSNSRFRDIFTALGADLSSIVDQLGMIKNVVFNGEVMQILVVRGGGTDAQTFIINLIRGEDGMWRIEDM